MQKSVGQKQEPYHFIDQTKKRPIKFKFRMSKIHNNLHGEDNNKFIPDENFLPRRKSERRPKKGKTHETRSYISKLTKSSVSKYKKDNTNRIPTLSPAARPQTIPSIEIPTLSPNMVFSATTTTPTSYRSISKSKRGMGKRGMRMMRMGKNRKRKYAAYHPSISPSQSPTAAPMSQPSLHPSNIPSLQPSMNSTRVPTVSEVPPSLSSTNETTNNATAPRIPTIDATRPPSAIPTSAPSSLPSTVPSTEPTLEPTVDPLRQPLDSLTWRSLGGSLSSASTNAYEVQLSNDGKFLSVNGESGIHFFELDQEGQWELRDSSFEPDGFLGVTISGDTASMAVQYNQIASDEQYATIFERNTVFERKGDIILTNLTLGEDVGTHHVLSDDGNVYAVADCLYQGRRGRVLVFEWNSTISDWMDISPILEGLTEPGDELGRSIDLSGDGRTLAACAIPRNDAGEQLAPGYCHVLRRVDSTDGEIIWEPLGMRILGQTSDDAFGHDVSLGRDGAIMAISAPNFGNNAGRVYVFGYDHGISMWPMIGRFLNGESEGRRFGKAIDVSANGEILVVGADGITSGTLKILGYVDVYRFSQENDNWEQIGERLTGDSFTSNSGGFGYSVSISNDGFTIAVLDKNEEDALLSPGQTFSFRLSTTTQSVAAAASK